MPKRKNVPLTAEQANLQKKIECLQIGIRCLSENIRKQAQLLTKVTTDINPIQNKLNKSKREIDLLQNENNQLLQSISELQNRLNVEAAPSEEEKELDAKKSKYMELTGQLSELTETYQKLELELNNYMVKNKQADTFQPLSVNATIEDFLRISNALNKVKNALQTTTIPQQLSELESQIKVLNVRANESKTHRVFNYTQIKQRLAHLEARLEQKKQELARKLELQGRIEKDFTVSYDIFIKMDTERTKLVKEKYTLEAELKQLTNDFEASFKPNDKPSHSKENPKGKPSHSAENPKDKPSRSKENPRISRSKQIHGPLPLIYFLGPPILQLPSAMGPNPNNNNNSSKEAPAEFFAQDASANRVEVQTEESAYVHGNPEQESFEEFYERFVSGLSYPQSSNNNDNNNNNAELPPPISSGSGVAHETNDIFYNLFAANSDDPVVSEDFVKSFFDETTNNNNNNHNNNFNQVPTGAASPLLNFSHFSPAVTKDHFEECQLIPPTSPSEVPSEFTP